MDLVSSEARRGGTRGGRDQFNWNDVKSDKHRENYLGHSVLAPVGRWQNGRDLLWYTRDGGAEQNGESAALHTGGAAASSALTGRSAELERIRKRELEIQQRALRGGSLTDAIKVTVHDELERVTAGGDGAEAATAAAEREKQEESRRKEEKLKRKEERRVRREERTVRKAERRKERHERRRAEQEEAALRAHGSSHCEKRDPNDTHGKRRRDESEAEPHRRRSAPRSRSTSPPRRRRTERRSPSSEDDRSQSPSPRPRRRHDSFRRAY